MDSHAIRCFQRVFEKKSIHQAAKDLCMTPQGVSRVISALEGEMQTALFIRSRKGMEATPEGRYFYDHTAGTDPPAPGPAAGDTGVEAEKIRLAHRLLLRRPEYPLHPCLERRHGPPSGQVPGMGRGFQ